MAGGGFGALDSMNKTLSNNRNLLRSKSMYEVVKESSFNYKIKQPYKYKEAKAAHLDAIRSELARQRTSSIKKRLLILLFSTLVGSGLFYGMMSYFIGFF